MEAANRHNNNFVDLEEGRRPEGAFRRDGEDGDLARLLQHLSPPSLWAEEDEEGGGEEAHMTADSSTTTRGDQPLQEDQQAVGISDLSPSTRRVLSGCYWSYLCFMLSSLMAVVVALVTALSVNGSNTCEKPLRAWASVEICIVVAQAVLTLLIHCKFGGSLNLDSLHRHPNVPRGTLVTAYSFNRLLNMFWFIWFIVGCSWTFADTDCKDKVPVLWITCVVLMALHLTSMGLVVCCCFCTCGLIVALYQMRPQFFGVVKGASQGQIERNSNKVKFFKHNGEQSNNHDDKERQKFEEYFGNIEEQSRMCAICLCDYEHGEEIRFLPCRHHFHASCVDQWLLQNKSCASCRTPIAT
ncbi:RING-H2 finger protein ATL80 [Balamuthia mandrillaris]